MSANPSSPYRLLVELGQAALTRMRQRNTEQLRSAELLQLEQMRETFRRYVSPRLADQILADVDLRDSILTRSDHRTRAVVMFADMRGFTRLAGSIMCRAPRGCTTSLACGNAAIIAPAPPAWSR